MRACVPHRRKLTYADTYSLSNTDCHSYSYGDRYGYRYSDTDGYSYVYCHTNSNSYAYGNRHGHAYSNIDRLRYSQSDADPEISADAKAAPNATTSTLIAQRLRLAALCYA